MLKQLMEIWREGDDPLEEMVSEFEKMLDRGQRMFRSVTDALFLGGDFPALKIEIYESDQNLNRMEQELRRKIVVHLSLGHGSDLTPSLILMSIVKDAERIGDYAKNIFEIGEIVSPLKSGNYLEPAQKLRNAVLGFFGEVKECFVHTREEQAREFLRKASVHQKEIDNTVAEILKDQKLENSVAFALLFRFIKRILSHLGNIATSVVMPVDKLDYFDEDNREKISEFK